MVNFNLSMKDARALVSRDAKTVYQCPSIKAPLMSYNGRSELYATNIKFDSDTDYLCESHTLFTVNANGDYVKQDRDMDPHTITSLTECILNSLEDMNAETFTQYMQRIMNVLSAPNYGTVDNTAVTMRQAAHRFTAAIERTWHLLGRAQHSDRYYSFGDPTTQRADSAQDTNYLRIFVMHDGDTRSSCISIETLHSYNIVAAPIHVDMHTIDPYAQNASQIACGHLHRREIYIAPQLQNAHANALQIYGAGSTIIYAASAAAVYIGGAIATLWILRHKLNVITRFRSALACIRCEHGLQDTMQAQYEGSASVEELEALRVPQYVPLPSALEEVVPHLRIPAELDEWSPVAPHRAIKIITSTTENTSKQLANNTADSNLHAVITTTLNTAITSDMDIDVAHATLLIAVPLLTERTVKGATQKLWQILLTRFRHVLDNTQIQQLITNIIENTNMCDSGEDYVALETQEISECDTQRANALVNHVDMSSTYIAVHDNLSDYIQDSSTIDNIRGQIHGSTSKLGAYFFCDPAPAPCPSEREDDTDSSTSSDSGQSCTFNDANI